MTKHEYNTKQLRKAAKRVAEAKPNRLAAAVNAYGYYENEWQNSTPRDSYLRPV